MKHTICQTQLEMSLSKWGPFEVTRHRMFAPKGNDYATLYGLTILGLGFLVKLPSWIVDRIDPALSLEVAAYTLDWQKSEVWTALLFPKIGSLSMRSHVSMTY